jgi:hypothetical protein
MAHRSAIKLVAIDMWRRGAVLLCDWQQCAAVARDDAAALEDKATQQVCADGLGGIFGLDE